MAHSFEDGGQKFIGLIERETELYRQILSLTEKQPALIAANEIEKLCVLLQDKQIVVKQVEELNNGDLGLLKKEWDVVAEMVPEPTRQAVGKAFAGLRELLAKIISLDDHDRQAIQAMSRQTADALLRIQKGKQMGKAYKIQKPNDSRFTDKQT